MKIKEELISKLKAFAGKRLSPVVAKKDMPAERDEKLSVPKGHITGGARKTIMKTAVVAIGTSTGGTKALQEVLPKFPSDFPAAILVVQHMPKVFTGSFAERMDSICHLSVREAQEGDLVRAGEILVAPGDIHMKVVRRKPMEVNIELTRTPEDCPYRPSIDVMMHSVADVYSGRSLGVILTGMGADGVKGMISIKKKRGRTIAQDEASSMVYGMPKAVVDAGAADKVVSLSQVAGEIMNMI